MTELREIEALTTESPDVIMSAKLSLRSNFATNHLRVATQAAQSAYSIEHASDTSQHGTWFDGMMMHVPVAITMAAAALEANCNEIIQDILDGSTPLGLAQGHMTLLRDLKHDRSGNTTDHYRHIALLLDQTPDTGSLAWQDAALLVRFRNALMHFKPAWDSETDIHDGKWVRTLKAKVPISPGYQSNFMFPYGFMTYGCAKWAVQSSKAFAAQFSSLIGVPDRFAGIEALP